MPSESLIAAVVQLCARQDVEHNLERCEATVRAAARAGGELIVLPENFPFIGGLRKKLSQAEPAPDPGGGAGSVVSRMMKLAKDLEVYLLLGGVPIVSPRHDRFYNTSILVGPDGKVLATYEKIHLFDVDIPGGAVFKESEVVLPGERAVTCQVGDITLGLSICYDLRFPHLYQELCRQGATCIAVPAAFTLHTGKDHWIPLLRARAIETQSYILAANQFGHHMEGRDSYGKSAIVDPWGAVVAQVPDRAGFALAELDMEYLGKIRRELPSLQHRRDLK